MLLEAARLALAGRAVYVITATREHAKQLESQVAGLWPLGIKFETPDSVENFCWRTMSLTGAHPNCVVLVDHFAIESHFAEMLDMLHRFDPDQPKAA